MKCINWPCLTHCHIVEHYFLVCSIGVHMDIETPCFGVLSVFIFSICIKNKSLPNIRKACSAFTAFGASSLNTDIISRKSSNVQSPSRLELNIRQILSPNGFTCNSGYWSIFDRGSLAFLLCPTFSGARALNF